MNQELMDRLESEIRDDIGTFCVEDPDDLESWAGSCLGCPNGAILNLLEQIPKGEEEQYYDKMEVVISDVCEKFARDYAEDNPD